MALIRMRIPSMIIWRGSKIESGVKKQADDLEKRKSEMEKELLDLDRNRSRLGVKDFIQKKNRYTAERDSIQRETRILSRTEGYYRQRNC